MYILQPFSERLEKRKFFIVCFIIFSVDENMINELLV
jgi:hypothetical protein